MIQILPENKWECCGCSACVQKCPQACISMVEDQEGFRYPEIDTDKCIECNLCEKVCPVIRKKDFYVQYDEKNPRAIGGWHKKEDIRLASSSGGAFSLFAEYVLKCGGIVYGCALKEGRNAEHIGVECIKDLGKLRGSKYVQSNIADIYKEIKVHLDNNRKVFFTGTPCQCAGLHSFLDKQYNNLYICDFICHGVPSPKIFQSYINSLEEKNHDKIVDFHFRNKDRGWHPSGLQMGTKVFFSHIGYKRFAPAFKDAYMNGFLDDVYLRPSCYKCEFKCLPKYYSDITIADFWGVKKVDSELYDGKGTSLVLIHSKQGEGLFKMVKKDFFYKEVDFISSIRRNKSLLQSAAWNLHRDSFFLDYFNKKYTKVEKKYMNAFVWASHKVMKLSWNCIEKVIKIILTPFLRILNQTWDDARWDAFLQFVKFSIVGVSNSMVSYLLNITALYLLKNFGLSFDYVIANLTAFLLSVLWSFHWNSRYVFRAGQQEKGTLWKMLLKTYISYGFTGIILNNVLATIWIQVLGISKYLSPLLNMPISIPVNFFMQKLWAYKHNEIERGLTDI